MVHNGIEHADMQPVAETRDLLRQAAGCTPAAIADVFRAWSHGRLTSFLTEITAEAVAHTGVTGGLPFVDVVRDFPVQWAHVSRPQVTA